MIDELNLKDLQLEKTWFQKTQRFIINHDGASGQDIIAIIKEVKEVL